MNAPKMIRRDSPKTDPPAPDDEMQRAIDAIMAASVRREEVNEALRAALDALLLALDSRGEGLAAAISRARAVRR